MTRARVTALQAARPPKGARLVRGTVSAVSPLTVRLAGGGAVAGIPVPGATYTVGGAVYALVQEPGVGPVYPLPGTATVPTTTGTLAYAGTVADWGTTRRSVLIRDGRTVTLSLQITFGTTAPTVGATLATAPAGFRPDFYVNTPAVLFNGGFNNQTAVLEVQAGGGVTVSSASVALAANQGLFGTITYPAAAGT